MTMNALLCAGSFVNLEDYTYADLRESERGRVKIVGFVDLNGDYKPCATVELVVERNLKELEEKGEIKWHARSPTEYWYDNEYSVFVHMKSDQYEMLYRIPGKPYTSSRLIPVVARIKPVVDVIGDDPEKVKRDEAEKLKQMKKRLSEKYGVPEDVIQLDVRVVNRRNRILDEFYL